MKLNKLPVDSNHFIHMHMQTHARMHALVHSYRDASAGLTPHFANRRRRRRRKTKIQFIRGRNAAKLMQRARKIPSASSVCDVVLRFIKFIVILLSTSYTQAVTDRANERVAMADMQFITIKLIITRFRCNSFTTTEALIIELFSCSSPFLCQRADNLWILTSRQFNFVVDFS